MIKNSSKIFALILLLCSCTADQPGDTPFGASPANAGLSMRGLAAVDATGTTPLATSVDVGFYVQALSAGGKTYYTDQNNVRGTYDTERASS